MRNGSLFSGIGGFDYAAEMMGWENVFHCEWEEFPRTVLKYYWPDAISYGDITKTDFTIHRGQIDILTGGFPCQPYSQAGKRLGKEDDRHLWPSMCRAIREIQPTWVVGENVRGLINWSDGLVFEEVQADLEAEGYEVQPFILPACAVDAPHRRDRIWFVAYRNSTAICEESNRGRKVSSAGREKVRNINKAMGRADIPEPTPNTKGNGDRGELRGLEKENGGKREPKEHGKNNNEPGSDGKVRNAADTNDIGLQRGSIGHESQSRESPIRPKAFRKLPRQNWQDFPTQSPVCSGNDELPDKLDGITFSKWRNESIKGYGNAVVPALVMQIFKAIEEYNQTINH